MEPSAGDNGGKTSLGHVPAGERWDFDQEVTDVFDDMLARSIPQLGVMRDAVYALGCRHVVEKGTIVDLGCARGDAIARFVDRYGAHNRYVGVEVSKPMLEATRARFKGLIECSLVDVRELDLRRGYPPVSACLTLAVLTLQFTPIEHRMRIISDAWKHTVPGGALVLVEKVIGSTAELDGAFVEQHHEMKRAAGYTNDEIDRKRLALEGVLVPVTARWNEELLRAAGFRHVESFWRWMNFCGWIAVR
jgi:tRNA (cmo5U34)-methyltransferase